MRRGMPISRRMAHLLMREEPVSRGLSFRIGGDEFVTLFEGEEEETLLRELGCVCKPSS